MEKKYIKITLDNYEKYLKESDSDWREGLEFLSKREIRWQESIAYDLETVVDNLHDGCSYRLDKAVGDKRVPTYPDLTNAKVVKIRTLDSMWGDPNLKLSENYGHFQISHKFESSVSYIADIEEDLAHDRVVTLKDTKTPVRYCTDIAISPYFTVEPWMVEEVIETYPEEIVVEHKITVNGKEIDVADISDESMAKILEAAGISSPKPDVNNITKKTKVRIKKNGRDVVGYIVGVRTSDVSLYDYIFEGWECGHDGRSPEFTFFEMWDNDAIYNKQFVCASNIVEILD